MIPGAHCLLWWALMAEVSKNNNSLTAAYHALIAFSPCFSISLSDRASVRSCVNTQTFEVALCHHMASPPGVIPLSIWPQDRHWQAAYGSVCSNIMETSVLVRLVPGDYGVFISMFPVCLSNTPLRSLWLALSDLGHYSVTSLPNAYPPASL